MEKRTTDKHTEANYNEINVQHVRDEEEEEEEQTHI